MTNKIIIQAVTSVLAALSVSTTIAATTHQTVTPAPSMESMGNLDGVEKCYGVAKAGRNDCGTATHQCAGESPIDNDPKEWIALPNGTCQKIIGGSTKAPE